MNAPANILPERSRYGQTLAAMVPQSEPEDLRRLRRRLLTSRDIVTRDLSIGGLTEDVRALKRVILHIATDHCFRPEPADVLKDAADLCVRLLSAVSTLERLEGSDGQA